LIQNHGEFEALGQEIPVTSDVDEVTAERQGDVQRKLGRFLIRVQQYERLLKALVIDSEHEGNVDTMLVFKEERVKRFATKSLGMVVEELTKSYIQLSRPADEETPDDEPDGLGADKPYFRFKAGIEMDAESLVRTKADLENLVELRNGVVHHLIEKFNVWTLDGCDAAIAHIDAAFATVDAAFSSLKQWAHTAEEARALHIQFMQSSEFLNMLTHSVMPDGTSIGREVR
jgi:hypothetical protein